MRPRVAEIRKITALLDQQWEDVEQLSKAVIETVFTMVQEREQYVVLMFDDRLGVFVFGTYDTEGGASKAIGKTIVSPGPTPARAVVRKVIKEKE
jgi:hypothetical protein